MLLRGWCHISKVSHLDKNHGTFPLPSSLYNTFINYGSSMKWRKFSSEFAWFLYITQPRCIVSSKNRVCHLVLVNSQEQCEESVLFCGPLGPPWLTTHKELSYIRRCFVGIVCFLLTHSYMEELLLVLKGVFHLSMAMRSSVSNDFLSSSEFWLFLSLIFHLPYILPLFYSNFYTSEFPISSFLLHIIQSNLP